MKYTILLAIVASVQTMDTVPIASLIELNKLKNEDPPVSGSGLQRNKKICRNFTD